MIYKSTIVPTAAYFEELRLNLIIMEKNYFSENKFSMKRFKMDLNEEAFQEFGVIAGSNKRRVTWHDVKMLLPSMDKMEFLEDKPITFIWSDDPRLEGYKTKAFKDIVFKFYNGSTTKDISKLEDIDDFENFFKCLGDGLPYEYLVGMNIQYESTSLPYRVILDGKRRFLAAAATGWVEACFIELDPEIELKDYLSAVNPSLLNN